MRGRWLCCVSAAVLAVISGACSANAQEVQAAEVLLTIIGESPAVVRAIESVLGAEAAGILVGKSAAQVGKFAVSNNRVAATIAANLSTADKLEWAGAVNSLRLTEFHSLGLSEVNSRGLSRFYNAEGLFTYQDSTLGRPHLLIHPPKPLEPAIDPDEVSTQTHKIERTLGITPLGDLKVSPKLEVPLMTFGNIRLQTEIETIPVGKLGLTAGTATVATTCGEECIDAMRRRWKALLGEHGEGPVP
jgi:hypothetical protein